MTIEPLNPECNEDFLDDSIPPVVSIVTVCRNSATTIARTFQSLLNQSFVGMESIVIDGASSDHTMEIVNDYRKRFQAKGITMSVVSEPDDGIYDAMNKGIKRCRAELIGILNSDDQYEPEVVEKMYNAACKNPDVGIVYGFLRLMQDGRELNTYRYNYDYILSDLSAGVQSAAQHPTCFVRSKVYDIIGTFDPSYRMAADYDFLLRAKSRGVEFLALDEIITTFPLGGVSTTTPEKIRHEERYRAQFANGLIDNSFYQKKLRQLRMGSLQRLFSKVWVRLCRRE